MKRLIRKQMEKMGIIANELYKGELYGTVSSIKPIPISFRFTVKPEISIEGITDKISVVVPQPSTNVGKSIGNYWGAHLRKGDRVYMVGTLAEAEILYWSIKEYGFTCNLLYNEDIQSGYGIREMKKRKLIFKGKISGMVTGIITTWGMSGSRFGVFFSIGLKFEETIAGLPEEITVHLPLGHRFSLGDEAIIDGEIISVKLKGTDFEIFEMYAEHWLNKTLNVGF